MKNLGTGPKKGYKTIEVCKIFDISRATLFRWEREGRISGPARDWRNWRIYTAQNLREIKDVIESRRSIA